jgi:hypothetical protein
MARPVGPYALSNVSDQPAQNVKKDIHRPSACPDNPCRDDGSRGAESGCTRSTGKGLSSVTRTNCREIVAELIVMAGLQGVAFVDTLPRRLYFRILSILRPAEYAARRIILIAACKLEWNIRIVEAKAGNKPAESLTSPPTWGPKDGSRRVARPLKICPARRSRAAWQIG